jgi:predicted MPP superfamily phosphohydrolase
VWQSLSLVITEVSIPLKNLPPYWQNKSIVHIADLHLSDVNQIAFLENVVEKIQDISPEIVVITGDLFDGRNSGKQDLLSPFKKLSVPILFTTGNHDRYFSSGQDFKDLGIDYMTFLNNELFEKEGLQIIGLGYPRRPDNEDPAEILKNEILFDENKPTILLYHTPTTIEAAKKGDRYISPNTDFSFVKNSSIDLQLSAHTHGGQFSPATLITHFIYKGYEKGLHRDGNFSLFVNTGLGTWGPPVRIFAPPEIAVIHLGETF